MKSNLISKLRLCLVVILTMAAVSAYSQDIVLDRTTLRFNSAARDVTFKVESSTVDWTVKIEYPDGLPSEWLSVKDNGGGLTTDTYPITVTLHADENQSTDDRNATIIVSGGEASDSIEVTQLGKAVELVLSTDNISFGQPAGDRTFTVTSNVEWSVTSSDTSWLTVTNNSSGTGNESAPVIVTIHATENTKSDSRTATITVTGGDATQTITVTQLGKSANISLSTANISFGQPAGDRDFTVTSNVSWTVTSSASWLTVTENSSGVGNESAPVKVTIHADENTKSDSRTATITVTGGDATQTITVTQLGKSANISLSTANISFGQPAGDRDFTVTSNVSWTVTSSASWLTVTENSSGVGNESAPVKVTIHADENTNSDSRTAMITVTGGDATQTITVTQLGKSANISLSTANISFGQPAGDRDFTVTSNVSWTVTSSASWLTVTENANGVGNESSPVKVTIHADENTNSDSRTAMITVTGGDATQTITVTQLGKSANISLSTANISFGQPAGDRDFTVTSNVSWSVTSSASWLTVTENANGVGNESSPVKVTIHADENTNSDSRTATITVTGGDATQTIIVTQLGKSANISLSTANISFGQPAGDRDFTVTSNVSWSVTSSASWLTVTENSSGVGNESSPVKVTIHADENTNSDSRTATITVTGGDATQTIIVTQLGKSANISLSTANISFGQPAGDRDFTVTSNVSWSVTSSDTSWLTVTENANGVGNESAPVKVTIHADENTNSDSRMATITVSGGGTSRTIGVTQLGKSANISLNTETLSFGSQADYREFTVTSNVAWEVTTDAEWLTVTDNSNGAGNEEEPVTVTVYATENNSDTSRSATITVSGGGTNHYINVTQQGGILDLGIEQLQDTIINANPEYDLKFNIVATVNWEIKKEEYPQGGDATWLQLTPSQGRGGKEISIKATRNATPGPRRAKIIISEVGGKEQVVSFVVVQRGTAKLQTNINELEFDVCSGSKEFKVTDCNTEWSIITDQAWLTIDDAGEDGVKYGENDETIILNAEENYGAERYANVFIQWVNDLGVQTVDSIIVTQHYRPVVPVISLADADRDGFRRSTKNGLPIMAVDATVGKEASIAVDIKAQSDSQFNASKWKFVWTVDDESPIETGSDNSLAYIVPNKRVAHKMSVTASYIEGGTNLDTTFVFTLYPAPKDVSKFEKKGQNNNQSGIWLASVDGMTTDSLFQYYEFVYGKGNTLLTTTKNRYYQYSNLEPEDYLWVYTQWYVREIDDVNESICVTSINTRDSNNEYVPNTRSNTTDAIGTITGNSLALLSGRLVGQVTTSSSAKIIIVALNGKVVRQYNLSKRTVFDEQINLTDLSAGLYIIRCEVDGQHIEDKIVVR